MDWMLICLAIAFMGVAIWLWRFAQPRLVNLGYIPTWLRRWTQLHGPTGEKMSPVPLPPTRPAAPPPPAPRVHQPTVPIGVQPAPEGWLVLRSSPRTGQQFGLKRGRNIVGRDPSRADIVLDDETISGEHACIQFEQGQFYIYNLSASKTYVNNRDIGRSLLFDGDRIQISQTVMIFKQTNGGRAHEDGEGQSPPPVQRRFRHQIVATGKLPTRMYEQDSCVLQLRLLPSQPGASAVQDSRVISFTSDHEGPRVEVELQAVGFEVAGDAAQAHVWDGKQPHQCLWNVSPRRAGSFEIGLVFRAQTVDVMGQIDALVYPISVRNYAGLSKQQVKFLARALSTAGTLLGLAEVLHRMDVF